MARPQTPSFTKLKQVWYKGDLKHLPPKPFTIQGGLFLVSDRQRAHPLNFEYGKQMIERFLQPGETFESALLAIGEQVKQTLVQQLEIGGRGRSTRPLSPYTIAARQKHGSDSKSFLYDTGTLANGLEVVLAKPATSGRRGYSGFIIRDRGDRFSSHSGGLKSGDGLGDGLGGGNAIGLWRLLNILCSTGLAIYAKDLTPVQLRRIMAFRDRFFAGAGAGAAGYSLESYIKEFRSDWRKSSESPTGYVTGSGAPATELQISETRESWAEEAKYRPDSGTSEDLWAKVETTRRSALGGRSKPLIFIPPRPLMTDEMRKDLEKMAVELSRRYFEKALVVTAAVIGSEPWSPGTVSKHAADMSRIEI